MRAASWWLAAVVFSVALNASGEPQSSAPSAGELQELYRSYNDALLSKDGGRASSYLHPDILAIYADALKLARSAQRSELQAVAPHKRLLAFYIRWAVPSDIARHDDPRALIDYMVREGALRSDAGVSTDLRDFTFESEEAVGALYAQGQRTPARIRFARVEGTWKIDLTNLQQMSDDIYSQMAARQKIPVDEALLKMVAARSAKPLTEAIWDPLQK